MLHDVDYSAFRTKAWQLMPDVIDHVCGLEDGKQRFANAMLAASHAFPSAPP